MDMGRNEESNRWKVRLDVGGHGLKGAFAPRPPPLARTSDEMRRMCHTNPDAFIRFSLSPG